MQFAPTHVGFHALSVYEDVSLYRLQQLTPLRAFCSHSSRECARAALINTREFPMAANIDRRARAAIKFIRARGPDRLCHAQTHFN
jgi:hypothetical protein